MNGGCFQEDSSTLHLFCTLFLLFLHQLYLSSSGIRSGVWRPLLQNTTEFCINALAIQSRRGTSTDVCKMQRKLDGVRALLWHQEGLWSFLHDRCSGRWALEKGQDCGTLNWLIRKQTLRKETRGRTSLISYNHCSPRVCLQALVTTVQVIPRND